MTTSQTSSPAARTAYRPAWRDPAFKNSPQLNFDIPDSLLAEVDFKWLMAGQGWWVDTTRFHEDPTYAKTLLRCAMGSRSSALRVCAAALLTEIERVAASKA